MKRYAIINTDTHEVESIVDWDGSYDWSIPDGYRVEVAPDWVIIGSEWEGGNWIENTTS